MIKVITLCLMLLAHSSAVVAGDKFVDNAEDIINALSGPKPAVEPKVEPQQVRRPVRGVKHRKRGLSKKRKQLANVEQPVAETDKNVRTSVNLSVHFDSGSYAIRGSARVLLEELGKALCSTQLQQDQFLIVGHTDSDGGDAKNKILSLARANSIKTYLMTNFQIDAKRLSVKGLGASSPLVPNTSGKNRQLNRRVEVVKAHSK